MFSRISARVCACPSDSSPAAEQSWPGRAISALEGVVLHEGSLQRMQAALRSKPLDRGYFCAIPRNRQNEAGVDPDAVDENRAGAALPVITALFGSGQL